MRFKRFIIVLIAIVCSACAGGNIFPQLGDELAAPVSFVIDTTNKIMYVINSNSRVLYRDDEGSMQTYNITDPTNLSLINTLHTLSFSGQAYFDATTSQTYVTNRYGTDSSTSDRLFLVDVNASGGMNLNSEVPTALNPFSMKCCYPANRMWISSDDNLIQHWDIGATSVGTIDLLADLSDGSTFTRVQIMDIALNNNQAYVSRLRGGIMVLNLDETTKESVDYFIEDAGYPKGLFYDGTYLYVATDEKIDGDWKQRLLVLDVSSLTPRTDNTDALIVDKDDDGLLVAAVEIADDPQMVIVFENSIWVSCQGDDDMVVVINATDWSIEKNISIKDDPFTLASYTDDSGNKYVFIGSLEGNTITTVDATTKEILATFP